MAGRSSFIKFVVLGVVLFGVGVIVLNLISYNRRQNDYEVIKKNNANVPARSVSKVLIQTKADFESDSKPARLIINKSDIDISKILIRTYKISVNDGKQQTTVVREAGEGNFNVLFLHGQKSSSKIWEKTGTLQHLTTWGYRAITVDIPDFRNGSLPVTGDEAAVQWLTRLIRTLRLSNLVIVSPSISGRLTLPYILQLNEEQQIVRGFVPIAPVGTDKYDSNGYKKVNIPTLIVHGENDDKFKPAVDILKKIPSSKILIIQNAAHACYVEKPIDFHNGLREFLYNVYRPIHMKQYKKSLLPKDNKRLLSNRTKSANKQNKKQHDVHQ